MQSRFIIFLSMLAISLSSCIRDEPLNPEADILTFSLPDSLVLSDPTFNRNTISVTVRKDVDLTSVVPVMSITDGATVVPAIGTPVNLNDNVTYTVTSADGKHQRVYSVQIITKNIYKYSFENWKALYAGFPYLTPVEYDDKGNKLTPWDSSNKGISIYMQYKTAEEYPIHPSTDCVEGSYAAEMTSFKGPGNILGMVNIPLVAGSLFTGVLTPLNALKDPLLATQFGQPVTEKPLRMTGWYKYSAGTGNYYNSDGTIQAGKKDSCSIFAVFYRTDETLKMLDGTNIKTHPNIVAIAMLPAANRAGSKDGKYEHFDIPFEYKEGVTVDFSKYTYKMTIALSSSYYGDKYEGQEGSRLLVDDLEIVME